MLDQPPDGLGLAGLAGVVQGGLAVVVLHVDVHPGLQHQVQHLRLLGMRVEHRVMQSSPAGQVLGTGEISPIDQQLC